MLDHVSLTVNDVGQAQAFYAAALAPLGLRLMAGDGATFAGFGDGHAAFFWIGAGDRQSGIHVAFAAADRPTVEAFYAAALAAGGRDNGGPGVRPQYDPDYYAAFILDPDGNNIEAVCRRPA